MSYSGTAGLPTAPWVRAVGHPHAPIGMGEHVRSVWRAMDAAGIDAGIVDIYGPQGEPDPELADFCERTVTTHLGEGINVFCINGDEVEQALNTLSRHSTFDAAARNIIYPAWELERYPDEWAAQLQRFDEVWAPSAFIQEAVAKVVDIPVIHMPLACEVGRRGLRSRRHFGIRDSAYAFFFSFDFLSYVERKNPFGVIDAFSLLSEQRPYDDMVLVIKTNNSDKRPEMKARFDAAIKPLRERVVVIDGTLPELEMRSLVWLTDCFVSLHRSEGFGRGLSEAMAFGKPVIATAYSGNMDFCNEETALLVPYDLIEVKPGEYPHWEDQHWADPDVERAAAHMLKLLDQPESGRALGLIARERLLLGFSYSAAGLRYDKRLQAIAEEVGIPSIP